MLTAALYLRVSTEDQAKHGYSLSAQVEACRSRAERLGAAEVLTFCDEGVSGALLSRPGLDALREALRERRVDVVVVWDPDRLSRNLSHQLLLTEEIERARVRLEFVNFEWKNTPEGQLFYALRGAIAQYEKEKIRERTGRGRLQKAKQGKLPLAFRPYGYVYDPDTALLVVDPAEAQVVREIFRWFLEEGEGPNAIARRLNHLGVRSRRGGRWHRAVVRQILTNPVYTGVFYANRWDAAGVSLNRHRPKEDRVSPTLRPEADWVPVAVPALVEPAAWQEAQGRLERARRLWAGRPRSAYLLSGLIVCGTCGLSMAGFTGTDWGVKRRKYTCRRSYEGAPAGACGRTVAAEPLEEAVWAQVASWLDDPEGLIAAMPEPGRASAGAEQELAAVGEALARAEKGRVGVVAVLEQGLMPPGEAAAALSRIQDRLDELRRRQEGLRAAALGSRAGADPAEARQRAESALERMRAGALPTAERQRLVRAIITRVVLRGQTAEVHARWPALTVK